MVLTMSQRISARVLVADPEDVITALRDGILGALDELERAQASGSVSNEAIAGCSGSPRGSVIDTVCEFLEECPQDLRVGDVLARLRGVDDFAGTSHDGAPSRPLDGVGVCGAPNPIQAPSAACSGCGCACKPAVGPVIKVWGVGTVDASLVCAALKEQIGSSRRVEHGSDPEAVA